MKIKYLIFLVLFLFFVPCVFANVNWWDFGNVGYNEGNAYPYFSSNVLSNHDLSNDFNCNIDVDTVFAPIVADINSDGEKEIIIVGGSGYVFVYDFYCTLLDSYFLGTGFNSMPLVRSINNDVYLDIVVHSSDSIKVFNFQDDNLTLEGSINTQSANEFGLSCENVGYVNCEFQQFFRFWFLFPYAVEVCQDYVEDVFCKSVENPNKIYTYRLGNYSHVSTDTVGVGVNEFRVSGLYDGFSGVRVSDDFLYYVGFSPDNGGLNGVYVFNQVNDLVGICNESLSIGGNSNTKISVGVAKLGGGSSPSNIFVNSYGDNGGDNSFYSCDGAFNMRVGSVVDGAKGLSNWAVGDFAKQGENYGCILFYNSSVGTQTFSCFNNVYSRVIDANVSSLLDSVNYSINLVDYGTGDFLNVVIDNMIYEYSAGNNSLDFYQGFSDNGGGFTRVITSEKDTSRTDFSIYVNDVGIGVFGFDSAVNVSCGDGVCSGNENAIVCAIDCAFSEDVYNSSAPPSNLLATGEACGDNSSVCVSGLCLYGYCTLKTNGVGCSYGYECVSGVCSAGKCTKPSFWDSVDAGKDESFGDDTNTNNLLSIVTMATIGYGLMATGNPLAVVGGVAIVFGFGAFFVSVGWLQFWIFMMMILMGIVLAVVVLLLKFGGGN